jgi:hypothetical protein
MKFKLIIFVLFMFSSLYVVNAVMVDKPLNISISNCYSVNISAELTEGTNGDIQFVGCDKVDDVNFNCKCLSVDNNNFSVVMRTDNALIRNIRWFDVHLNVKYFDTFRKTMDFGVEDGGDYFVSSPESWVDRDKKVIIKEVPVYINKTVYLNNTIEISKEKIIYQDRNITINNTIYIANTTKIDKLKTTVKISEIIMIILATGLLLVIFIAYQQRKVING